MRQLASVVMVAVFSSAQAGIVIHVDDDNCPGPGDGSELNPYCSIQTAIDNAVDTDEIVVAPGTYFETINFLGKAITLRSSDGPDVTTIDAGGRLGAGSVVTCDSAEGPELARHWQHRRRSAVRRSRQRRLPAPARLTLHRRREQLGSAT